MLAPLITRGLATPRQLENGEWDIDHVATALECLDAQAENRRRIQDHAQSRAGKHGP